MDGYLMERLFIPKNLPTIAFMSFTSLPLRTFSRTVWIQISMEILKKAYKERIFLYSSFIY